MLSSAAAIVKLGKWLAPSLQHRIEVIMTWVQRLRRYLPVSAISQEIVKFDMQKMQNPEISGVEYQQGTLYGYEVREYLLEKRHRQCAYCGAKDKRLEVDHIVPRSHCGSDRVSNLTLSCEPCNKKKNQRPAAVFLAKKPEVLQKIQRQAKTPLKDAAAVNSTRYTLLERLKATGLPVERPRVVIKYKGNGKNFPCALTYVTGKLFTADGYDYGFLKVPEPRNLSN